MFRKSVLLNLIAIVLFFQISYTSAKSGAGGTPAVPTYHTSYPGAQSKSKTKEADAEGSLTDHNTYVAFSTIKEEEEEAGEKNIVIIYARWIWVDHKPSIIILFFIMGIYAFVQFLFAKMRRSDDNYGVMKD